MFSSRWSTASCARASHRMMGNIGRYNVVAVARSCPTLGARDLECVGHESGIGRCVHRKWEQVSVVVAGDETVEFVLISFGQHRVQRPDATKIPCSLQCLP